MQDVNHALANLRNQTGISTLDFDGDGNLSLLFNGDATVNFRRVDDETIELWTRLEGLGRTDDQEVLKRLLQANHLGEGTGAARLALTPAGDGVVLCERLDVHPLDDKQFADRLVEFLKHCLFWRSGDAADFMRSSTAAASTFKPEAYAIRI